jgi:hypothetical protein
MLQRQRERQAGMHGGRGAGGRGRGRGGARDDDGEDDDGGDGAHDSDGGSSLDDFIDDGDGEDWRREMRAITGGREGLEQPPACGHGAAAAAGSATHCARRRCCVPCTDSHTHSPCLPCAARSNTTRAGYDPSRYRDAQYDDRLMEATPAQIAAEEARSRRAGRSEDEREAEAEARRAAAKAAKKAAARGGARRQGPAALFDD